MKLYSSAQIRAIETQSLAAGLPLMARAGAAAAALAQQLLPENPAPDPNPEVILFCGPGNNGGDAWVAARHLHQAGLRVACLSAQGQGPLTPQAQAAHTAYLAAGGPAPQDWAAAAQWPAPPLVIDGLLGLGLSRPSSGALAQAIALINAWAEQGSTVLALDVPTGLQADTGQTLGPAVRAQHTLSMIGATLGLYTAAGCDLAGQVHVADLGLDLSAQPALAHMLEPSHFAHLLQARPRNSHKGHYGNARIMGGAAGMVGAALLAGRAALHLGAGRVYVGLLDEGGPALDLLQPELMLQSPAQVLAGSGPLCLGPGMGQSSAAQNLLAAALAQPDPLVLDADALNLLAQHPALASALQARQAQGRYSLLTPHEAEAGRLLGCSAAAVHADRAHAALALAQRYGCTVLLKGCGSLLAQADGHFDGRLALNPTGSPALATAGSGDVLAGMATALLGQIQTPSALPQAAAAAVYLHGLAAQELGWDSGLCASELPAAARLCRQRLMAAQGQKLAPQNTHPAP